MTPGVHEMSMKDYLADPCPPPSLSAGTACTLISQSPRHAWFGHPRLNPAHVSEEADKLDLGSCAHAVLLEGEAAICPIDAPDWRTKAAKEARDLARAEHRIPVLQHKLEDIRAMAEAARDALKDVTDIGPIDLSQGVAERVLIWQEGDAWCRARPDWMRGATRDLIIDYKSTEGSAEPGTWVRNQLTKMGYDLSALHYLRGNSATGGDKRAPYIFLVQENYAPFECSFVGLSAGMLEIAQRKWDLALAIWKRCLETNKWNGYPRRLAVAEPMAWHIDEDEQRRLTFDELLEYATV